MYQRQTPRYTPRVIPFRLPLPRHPYLTDLSDAQWDLISPLTSCRLAEHPGPPTCVKFSTPFFINYAPVANGICFLTIFLLKAPCETTFTASNGRDVGNHQ